eukprot:4465629-Ditylum_brightwellii.AAC.1
MPEIMTEVDAMASDMYHYLNFDKFPEFVESTEDEGGSPASLCKLRSVRHFSWEGSGVMILKNCLKRVEGNK